MAGRVQFQSVTHPHEAGALAGFRSADGGPSEATELTECKNAQRACTVTAVNELDTHTHAHVRHIQHTQKSSNAGNKGAFFTFYWKIHKETLINITAKDHNIRRKKGRRQWEETLEG